MRLEWKKEVLGAGLYRWEFYLGELRAWIVRQGEGDYSASFTVTHDYWSVSYDVDGLLSLENCEAWFRKRLDRELEMGNADKATEVVLRNVLRELSDAD